MGISWEIKYKAKYWKKWKEIEKCWWLNYEIENEWIVLIGTSPSGAHTEPWTFCVIQDGQVKREIRKIIEAEEYLNYTQRMSRQWTVDLRPLKTDYKKEYLTEAPYLIIVFKQIYGRSMTYLVQIHIC